MTLTMHKHGWPILSAAILLACLLLLAAFDDAARERRRLPGRTVRPVIHVERQAEVYRAYRNAGLWGASVVQFGRHFHLAPFFPHEKVASVPFPVDTFDVRLLYEQGVDSHTWLFIANKNGLVRSVTSVLPDRDLREKTAALESDFSFRASGSGYRGYTYDLPRALYPFSAFRCPAEPVVVNVDAGMFRDGIGPQSLYAAVRRSCPDVRMYVLVDSVDDEQVTVPMRRDLDLFRELLERERS